MGTLALRYRETNPGRLLRGYTLALRQTNGWTYGGARQTGAVQPSATLSWNNFWTTQLSAAFNLRRQDASLTRGGPLMGTPRGWNASAELRSSGTTQTVWTGRISGGADEDSGRQPRRHGRRFDVHAEEYRLQRPFVPQQRGVSLGVAARQHVVRGLAAEPQPVRSDPGSGPSGRPVGLPARARLQLLRRQDDVVGALEVARQADGRRAQPILRSSS